LKNVVIFAPHPDDEVLGCGGTIAKKLAEGYTVFVVFMTDGRYGLKEVGIDKNLDPLEFKTVRKEEALKAAKILGLKEQNMFFLDIEDKSLVKYKIYTLRKTMRILKDVHPAEIFFPQELEYNLDHRVTNTIVKEALKKLDLKTIEYRYAIAWKFPLYLLLHFLGKNAFYKMMCAVLGSSLFCVDISEFLSIKIKAIKQYASQLKRYSYDQSGPAIKQSILKISLENEEKFFV
jgi:LmbE family N-acetylglucosaminyl deacetylase